jgi:dihydropteroate synthase
MVERKIHKWRCRGRTVALGERTLVMGILNTTPDSFSDGGDFSDPTAAVERALEMAAQGADIIDIGGESTRPGAEEVSEAEEIRRTVPIIGKIREHSDVLVSIDTTKAEVAFQALEAGAQIINDVSALEADEKMAGVAAESLAGTILMHRKGSPKTMQQNPSYANVVRDVREYLEKRAAACIELGIESNRLVVDPGIGFGKTTEHNLELLRGLPELAECGWPVLAGASRKNFIGQATGRAAPRERLGGSLGVAAWAALHGAHSLRVHDIIDTCDACRLLDTLLAGTYSCN